jgi:hypothetical protein
VFFLLPWRLTLGEQRTMSEMKERKGWNGCESWRFPAA